MDTFKLKVVAHDKVFYDGDAQSLFVPAPDGQYQILAHHAECVVAVEPGEMRIVDKDGKDLVGVCGRGFLDYHMKEDLAEVLIDTIEKPEEIDVRRAQEEKERAEEELRQKQSMLEYRQSQLELAKAMARLKAASKYRK